MSHINPKTLVQQWCHRMGYNLPNYDSVSEGESHSPRWKARIKIINPVTKNEFLSIGMDETFRRKRVDAEQYVACKAMLHIVRKNFSSDVKIEGLIEFIDNNVKEHDEYVVTEIPDEVILPMPNKLKEYLEREETEEQKHRYEQEEFYRNAIKCGACNKPIGCMMCDNIKCNCNDGGASELRTDIAMGLINRTVCNCVKEEKVLDKLSDLALGNKCGFCNSYDCLCERCTICNKQGCQTHKGIKELIDKGIPISKDQYQSMIESQDDNFSEHSWQSISRPRPYPLNKCFFCQEDRPKHLGRDCLKNPKNVIRRYETSVKSLPAKWVYLVDLENVHITDVPTLDNRIQVIGFRTSFSKINDFKGEVISINSGIREVVDHYISFKAGMITILEPYATVILVSSDSAFEGIVRILQDNNMDTKLITSKDEFYLDIEKCKYDLRIRSDDSTIAK